jgi:predicted Zn-dependent protease
VAARALLALTAVLVLAWTAVLLRNYELGKDAAVRAFFGPRLSQAERNRDLQRLDDAQLLDPNGYWRIARANYQILDGDTSSAARAAERLVRDEPQNIFAWSTLLQATRRSNPDRAAQAAAEIRRLNPLGSR